MKKVLALSALTLLALAPMARTQQPMEPMALINRMQSNYRSLDSYKDTAVWTHKQGEKEFKAEINLAMAKPNKYLFEMKGDRLNTTVVSDGKTLLAYRPDRKAYTRTTAPVRITGANVLDKIEQPSAGTKIITALLQANVRDLDPQWQFNLSKARVSGPHDFGGKLAYTLTFPYTSEFDAKVYVTTGDFLVRRVQLLADSTPVITEDRMNIERNGKIDDSVFVRTLPELAKSVVSLPPLPDYTVPAESAIASGEWGNAPDFTVDTAEGARFTLSKLKGKAILLNFFFNT